MFKPRLFNFFVILFFLITVTPVSSIFSAVNQTPIILVAEITDNYTPVSGDGWDYYLLPPGTDFDNVYYWGASTSEAYYTNAGTNSFTTSSGVSLTRGDLVPANLLRNTFRDGNHPFFEPIPYPRAVRILNDTKPTFNQTMIKPLSLHMNYSSTFFAQDAVIYWGYVESDDPFFLDVSFASSDVKGDLIFDSTYPILGYEVGVPENKMSYPFFPIQDGIQTFTLVTNDSTLVTLTPRIWEFPEYLPELNISTVFTGELNQGSPWIKNETTDQLIKPDNAFFSLRMFSLSLTKDRYYRINAIFDMEDVKPGVPSPIPTMFLTGENWDYISGAIDQNGWLIRARETEDIILVFYSPGEANGDYVVFYQEEPSITAKETSPLEFGVDFPIEFDIIYPFTLSAPVMMAVNWTDLAGDLFDFTIYTQGAYPDEWIAVTTDDIFFDPVRGHLLGDIIGDIDAEWRYIPAGSYAIELDDWNAPGNEIRFTTVPIQQPGTLDVEEDSIFAIELPLVRNRLNWINLSTSDQVYPVQQVRYEWTFVGKYNEMISDPAQTDGWFGAENTSVNGNPGVWDSWDYNDTIINAFLPTRDYEVPILMIRPFEAQNETFDPLETFSATLTVTSNEANDQSLHNINNLGGVSDFVSTFPTIPYTNLYSDTGTQYFIPLSPISTTTSFSINDDYSTDDDHLYGIPLTLDAYTIYNITVYLIGNYSSYSADPNPSDFLNASFYGEGYLDSGDIFVHGGNLRSLEIFGTQYGSFNDTKEWRSLLILTVSSTSYLYIDLERQGGRNATLLVEITKLSLTNMDFNLDTQYNPTISNQEVFTDESIVGEIIPPEMINASRGLAPFPFEILLLLGGVVGIGAIVGVGIYYWRKRRSV
ncbi:MAG: hypothetical protein ACFFCZ_09260 [Promethearchaeota archaeon]